MRFSILVPVYNTEKYLKECVDSLINQTYKGEYEIILVDDGSTDNSGIICDDYKQKYPNHIKVIHKQNQGLVSSRDVGIANAKGEYCLFVDSDDFVENYFLQVVNKTIDKHNYPDLVIYSYNYYKKNRKSDRKATLNKTETVFENDKKITIYDALITTAFITALWIKAVKTSVLKKDTTDYSLYYDKAMGEDWFRSIPIVTLSEKIVYINEPLYNYRIDNSSISRNFSSNNITKRNMLYVYYKLKEHLNLWNLDADYLLKLNGRFFNEAIYTFTLFYENADIEKKRKSILNFDWNSMLPTDKDFFIDKNYCNSSYVDIYNWLNAKKYNKIKIFFIKKKLLKKFKLLKSRLLQK